MTSKVAIHTQASSTATYQNQSYFQKSYPNVHIGSAILRYFVSKNKIGKNKSMTLQESTFTKTKHITKVVWQSTLFPLNVQSKVLGNERWMVPW